MLKDEMNGRDRAARLVEWSHSNAGIGDDPPNDPGWMSYEYIPQIGACIACNFEVAEDDWYSDIAFCKGCAKAAGLP